MNEANWTRKEYESWDEAFRALAPFIRQQSVRVAEYTQLLFTAACAAGFGKKLPGGDLRMRGQYADTAYKCGLYHQLGKALVPPEYQVWQADFSEEEKAVYRKYTVDGRTLVATLQERTSRQKEKRVAGYAEQPTENIPWLMMRESCAQHRERYDGSGFPLGLKGEDISPVAQVVGLARELDRLSAEVKSERPFDEAFEELTGQAGTLWAPELIEVLKQSRERCREVYEKFIYYTQTLPETIPLVQRHEGRPLRLQYRAMLSQPEGVPAAYEAFLRFGGVAGEPEETDSAEELDEMLQRTELVGDVSNYFFYEAGDALLRLKNCKIETKGILLETLPSFYRQPSMLAAWKEMLADQQLDGTELYLTLPEENLAKGSKTTRDQIVRYLRNGMNLVLDGFHPTAFSAGELKELGIKVLRLAKDTNLQLDTANAVQRLKDEGFRIWGVAEEQEAMLWLFSAGAELVSGPLCGVLSDEDGIIRAALSRERQETGA